MNFFIFARGAETLLTFDHHDRATTIVADSATGSATLTTPRIV